MWKNGSVRALEGVCRAAEALAQESRQRQMERNGIGSSPRNFFFFQKQVCHMCQYKHRHQQRQQQRYSPIAVDENI